SRAANSVPSRPPTASSSSSSGDPAATSRRWSVSWGSAIRRCALGWTRCWCGWESSPASRSRSPSSRCCRRWREVRSTWSRRRPGWGPPELGPPGRLRSAEAVKPLVEVAAAGPPFDHPVHNAVVHHGRPHGPGVALDRLQHLTANELRHPLEALAGGVGPGEAVVVTVLDGVGDLAPHLVLHVHDRWGDRGA